jgi:hypothetical protein
MNGGAVAGYAGGWALALDWVVQGVKDWNGDGTADILWRQNSTGVVSLWLMNGGSIQSYANAWNVLSQYGIQPPSPGYITLAWDDNSATESGFKIERSLDGSTNWMQIGTTGPNVTSFTSAETSRSTTYFYRVRAYTASEDSTYSNTASAMAY